MHADTKIRCEIGNKNALELAKESGHQEIAQLLLEQPTRRQKAIAEEKRADKARQKAIDEEKRAEEARQKAINEEKSAVEARQKASNEEKKAKETRQKQENSFTPPSLFKVGSRIDQASDEEPRAKKARHEVEITNAKPQSSEEKAENLTKLIASLKEAFFLSQHEYKTKIEESKRIRQLQSFTENQQKLISRLEEEKDCFESRLNQKLAEKAKETQMLGEKIEQLIAEKNKEAQLMKETHESLVAEKTKEAQKLHEKIQQLVAEVSFLQNEGTLAGITRIMNQDNIKNMGDEQLAELEELLFHSTAKVNKIRNELRAEEDLCCICIMKKKSVVFLPCTHLCTCEGCSAKLSTSTNKCPLCNVVIQQRIVPFK